MARGDARRGLQGLLLRANERREDDGAIFHANPP